MSTLAGTRRDTPAPGPPWGLLGAVAVAVLLALRLAVGSGGTGESAGGGNGGNGAPGGEGPPGTGTVVEIVDGDTLVVDLDGDEEHVRLIGIDTPESVDPDRPDECFGAEASGHLAELVPPGTTVRLERDVEARDQYDRLLAYVYRASDDLFVNLAQVSAGYAETLAYPPNTVHAADFERAASDARGSGAGLWAACGSADVPLG